MATTDTATIVTLHQPRPKTGAERAKAYRDRKRAASNGTEKINTAPVTALPAPVTVTPVTKAKAVTPVTPSRPSIAQILLIGTSFALAGVGITMNGMYAHQLGSSQLAGWVFTAVGVAADTIALAIPSCAAIQWQASQRLRALAGWLVWLLVFAFTTTAGIGFASVNISDVTTSRASRITPAVTEATAALRDAEGARDRECRGGTGKFCREREATVTERRRLLDAAMSATAQTADPQIEAASKIVGWLTGQLVRPTADDFAMLRLILLSLLPQLGGLLLMVGRTER